MNLGRKAALAGAACVALTALIFWEIRVQRRLADELKDLRSRSQEAARVKADIARLTESVANLEETRKSRTAAIQSRQAGVSVANTDPFVPSGFTSVKVLKNSGSGTARDAYQTYLWALENSDAADLAKVLWLSGASQAKVESLYQELSPADQARYGTAQEMFALLYIAQHPVYFSAVRVPWENSGPEDMPLAQLVTQYAYDNGHVTEHNDVLVQKTSSGDWEVTVQDPLVARALKQVAPVIPPATPTGQP